ncbi:MAG: 2-succinyl-5-enolpyruvyl-6-hydroxy-3-cyclohexene-1-carboxylic-acid synthase [Propionibacteriaceae bacterium]|nr:2-succinyl-5-enolpyruvyl-6-hydroxy-3-cyclohexene-1-carboxylic-acid synthase [Propionibacteriaceae bacterium]
MSAQESANQIVAQLIAQGVRHLVLCPGSRSAPLALAAAQAERLGLAKLHVRTDERGAGFLALGVGKTGELAAVITTSGTAVGNLLPAVMEASHSRVPLLVVSADRPADWPGFGANQTTCQQGIFGGFVRWSTEIDDRDGERSWKAQVSRACLIAAGAFGGAAGPVQLNVHLREPLAEPGLGLPAASKVIGPEHRRPEPAAIPSDKTVVIAGDASDQESARYLEMLGKNWPVPVVAEPSSALRCGQALRCGRLVLNTELADEAQRVVVFGHPTLSRSVTRLLSRSHVEVISLGSDPTRNASRFVEAVEFAGGGTWLERWQEADKRIAARVDELAELRFETGLNPLAVAGVIARCGQSVFVGNSNPIRDFDLAGFSEVVGPGTEAALASRSVREHQIVRANRGLAGIDGLVSTAVGIALAEPGPHIAYLGDLSFLHDVNALAIGTEQQPDLTFVVADDSGGSIFSTLEYGGPEYAQDFERVFATDRRADLVQAARAMGVEAERVENLETLTLKLNQPGGMRVLVVGVDREHRSELNAALEALR